MFSVIELASLFYFNGFGYLQDVVFALAHATGKVGRFTLMEKWRNNERLLAPNENPLKVCMRLVLSDKVM